MNPISKMLNWYRQKKILRELRKHYGEGKRLGIKEPSDEELKMARERVSKEI